MESNLKQTEQENQEENKQEKKSFNLSTTERILFSFVLVLFGVIILINTVNTTDFQPTVKYISNSQEENSSTESSNPESNLVSTEVVENNTQANQPPSQSSSLININTASLEDLMKLNNINNYQELEDSVVKLMETINDWINKQASYINFHI